MKKTLSVLALSLCSSVAMADIMNFTGSVSATSTCDIKVVTPGGPELPLIKLGDYKTDRFTDAGQKGEPVAFALRVGASCVTGTQDAFATFQPSYGVDPDDSNLYALKDSAGYTTGLGLAIFDRTSQLAPNTESVGYQVSGVTDTDMGFVAQVMSTKAKVTEGQIDTAITFTVAVR